MCLARRALSIYPALNTPGIFSVNYSLVVTVRRLAVFLRLGIKTEIVLRTLPFQEPIYIGYFICSPCKIM